MSAPGLPPARRTDLGRAHTAAAVAGKLMLQHCGVCATVQYPPREVCCNCLSDALRWQETDNLGTVLAAAALQRSLEPYFQAQTPWLLGSVKLDCGPVVLLQLTTNCRKTGSRVLVTQHIDASGEAILVAKLDDRQQ